MPPTKWTTEMEATLVEAVSRLGYEWDSIRAKYFPDLKLDAIQNKWFTIKRTKNLNSLGQRNVSKAGTHRKRTRTTSEPVENQEQDATERMIDNVLKLL